MSTRRIEMNIPVTRDARTFEQRRRDMLSNLERRTTTSTSTMSQRQIIKGADPMLTHSGSDTTASSLTADTGLSGSHHSLLRGYDDWDEEVNRWIAETRSRWNEDMRRMRQDMFALEPVDNFGIDRWGGMYPFERSTDSSSMMSQMEREMQSLRQQMDSMGPISGTTRITGPGGSSTIQSSSSRITTTSSTSSSGDPRGMVTKSNVEESVKQSRTVNGVTTGTSSHSSMSSTSHGPNQSQLTHSTTPGALIPQSPVSGGMMNFLKDAYELDEDGQVHFKVRFDAKDFAPEDIDVTTVENRLVVHAKKNIQSGSSTSSKEFSRTIDLPQSIDHEKFRCNLTEDGVLILDAPVKDQSYKHITFRDDHQLGIKPRSEAQVETRGNSLLPLEPISPTGVTGPTVMKDTGDGRKLHLEVPVDPVYKAEDLCVRMDENRIIVSGKQQSGKGNDSNTTREFSRSYEIPETVDPFSVTAQLSGTTLIIEAPLLHTV